MREAILELPPDLFDYQIELIEDPRDELCTVSCPQIGKTEAEACWILKMAWEHPGSMCWWVGPTYRQVEDGFNAVRRVCEAGNAPVRFVEHKKIARFPNGSVIEFRSFDQPENLSGRTVHFMVVDEAHELNQRTKEILDSRRAATRGPVRYTGNGTVVGTEWWRLCQDAKDPLNASTMGFRHWTWESRYHALVAQGQDSEAAAYRAWIETRKRRMHESEFNRIYCAEWAVPLETIFAGYLDSVFVADWSDVPHRGHTYVIGTDIGLVSDYTVAVPFCLECMTATWYHREQGDSAYLENRLAEIYEHWNRGTGVIELNGPGQKVLDGVAAIYPNASGHWTDEVNKRESVFEWIAAAKLGGLTLPNEEGIIEEHRLFQSRRTPSGSWSFSAPAGGHDDRVMAGLIALYSVVGGPARFLDTTRKMLTEKASAAAA